MLRVLFYYFVFNYACLYSAGVTLSDHNVGREVGFAQKYCVNRLNNSFVVDLQIVINGKPVTMLHGHYINNGMKTVVAGERIYSNALKTKFC